MYYSSTRVNRRLRTKPLVARFSRISVSAVNQVNLNLAIFVLVFFLQYRWGVM